SDYGKNYNFRFVTLDLTLLQANVVSDPQTPYSGFNVEVVTIPEVTAVSVRFSVVNNPSFQKIEVNLTDTGSNPNGKRIWAMGNAIVPYRSNVRFKLFYVIGGKRYKDDNGGRYFLAPQPAVSPLLGYGKKPHHTV
ncbi:MAG: hypothetical protein PHU14_15840, partial [Methylovulum sp.]|nr:hypothetical protein [Methylovulum sp.]